MLILTVQVTLVAHASLLVHYAAFSAARSARVYFYDTTDSSARALRMTGAGNAASYWALNRNKAEKRARDAAALSLIALGPSHDRVPSREDSSSVAWKALPAMLRALKKEGPIGENVVLRKARYVFDRKNLEVEVSPDLDPQYLASALKGVGAMSKLPSWPVRADVTFRFHLALPSAWLLGEKGHDGYYARMLNARVRVL